MAGCTCRTCSHLPSVSDRILIASLKVMDFGFRNYGETQSHMKDVMKKNAGWNGKGSVTSLDREESRGGI